jgi:hypothetical protein
VSFSRQFLLSLLLIICIPLQGLAAASMPACQHMAAMLQAQAAEMDMSNIPMSADQDMTMDMKNCEKHTQSEPTSTHVTDCHKCYFCLMGVVAWLMPQTPDLTIVKTNTLYSSQPVLLNQTTNSPPYHPPKTLSA